MVDFNKALEKLRAEKERKEQTMGYTPKRTIAQAKTETTARQRFGAGKTTVEGAQNRTASGRADGKKLDPTSAQTQLPIMTKGERGMLLTADNQGFLPPVIQLSTKDKEFLKDKRLTIASVLGVPDDDGKPARRTPAKSDAFPLISTFDREDMDHARRLMEDDVEYQAQEEAVKEARAKIKKELAALAQIYHVPGGFRWGSIAVYFTPGKTKRTLSKTLLVEAGVPADVVADCYSESAPWDEVRVVDTSRPKKERVEED